MNILQELATRITRLENIYEGETSGIQLQPNIAVLDGNTSVIIPFTITYTQAAIPTPTHNIVSIISSFTPSSGSISLYNVTAKGFITVAGISIVFHNLSNASGLLEIKNVTSMNNAGGFALVRWGIDTFISVIN